MSEVATITLSADVTELERGNKALSAFEQQAAQAAKSADTLGEANKKTAKASATLAQEIDFIHRRVAESRERLHTLERVTLATAEAQDTLAESFHRQIDSIKPAQNAGERLKTVQASIGSAWKSGNLHVEDYKVLLSSVGDKIKQVTEIEERAGKARQLFLQRLKDQVTTQKMSRTELTRYRAAQLGASAAAEPYIKKLADAAQTTHTFSLRTAKARREMALMASQALRGNFSALGSSSITLANSTGLLSSLMSGRLMALTTTAGLAATAIYGLGRAYLAGASESEEFNKQLILTGHYAGKNASQLAGMASGIAKSTGSIHKAAKALSTVVGTGMFKGDEIEKIAKIALSLESLSIQDIGETLRDFEQLKKAPLEALDRLDEKYHHIAPTVRQYIADLQNQGKTQEAATAAINAHASAMGEMTGKVSENLGFLERKWKALQNGIESVKNELLSIGREPTTQDKLEEVKGEIEAQKKLMADQEGRFKRPGQDDTAENRLKKLYEKERRLTEQLEKENAATKAKAREKAWQEEEKAAQKRQESLIENEKNWAKRREQAKAQLTKDRKNYPHLYNDETFSKALKAIDEKYPKPSSSHREDIGGKRLLESKQRVAALKEQLTVSQLLTQEEQRLVKFNQQIADLKAKDILTAQEQGLLASADQIRESLKQEASLARQVKLRQEELSVIQSMESYLVSVQSKSTQTLAKYGMSARQASQHDELTQLKNAFVKEGGTFDEQGNATGAGAESYNRVREETEKFYADQAEKRQNWRLGAKAAWAEFGDAATDVYGNVQNIASNALNNLSGSMSDFLTTGKGSFSDFSASIMKDIVNMTVKMMLFNAISGMGGALLGGALGGMAGSAGSAVGGAGAAAGGTAIGGTGAMGLGISWQNFVKSPSLGYSSGYDGGEFEPRGIGYASPVQGLEVVSPDIRGLAPQAPSVSAPITVVFQGGNNEENAVTNNTQSNDAVAKMVQKVAIEAIQKNLKPGGAIWQAIRNR